MIHFRRSLKILAESYAIKGLCLENLGLKGTSKFKQAERETEMVIMFPPTKFGMAIQL